MEHTCWLCCQCLGTSLAPKSPAMPETFLGIPKHTSNIFLFVYLMIRPTIRRPDTKTEHHPKRHLLPTALTGTAPPQCSILFLPLLKSLCCFCITSPLYGDQQTRVKTLPLFVTEEFQAHLSTLQVWGDGRELRQQILAHVSPKPCCCGLEHRGGCSLIVRKQPWGGECLCHGVSHGSCGERATAQADVTATPATSIDPHKH